MPFSLREKRNTQDDPLDEYLHQVLTQDLPDLIVQRADGPLISPDMVVARPSEYERLLRGGEELNPSGIIGLEVKKVERQKSGGVARTSGLDYNSTPPCQWVRVYAAAGEPLDIPGFYLFVCQERLDETQVSLTALVLCAGAALNRDFEYYLSVVGSREKSIGLGTYGDGADRLRPMIIFANPLGFGLLDRYATLVHERHDLVDEFPELGSVGLIRRRPKASEVSPFAFSCYRSTRDVPPDWQAFDVEDPFPRPVQRVVRTSRRGMFRISLRGPVAEEIVPE